MEPEDVFLPRLEQAICDSPKTEAEILREAGLKPGFLNSARTSLTKGPSSWDLSKFARVVDRSVDWLLGMTEIQSVLRQGDVVIDLVVCDKLLSARRAKDVSEAVIESVLPREFSVYRPGHHDLVRKREIIDQAKRSLGLEISQRDVTE